MKRINKLSLRMRLTLLMSVLLICACSLFTAISILSAHRIYSDPPPVPSIKALPPPSDHPNGEIHTQLDINLDAQNSAFTLSSFVWFGIIVVLGALATYLVAGQALRPVTDLSKTIEDIDENNLFVQMKERDSDDEIAKLTGSFNHMTRKLQKAFDSQKRFAANAAHELKTPLSAIITDIEVLQLTDQPSVEEYKESVDNVLDNTQRLRKLILDLLQLNAPLPSRFECFDGGEMFTAICEELSNELDENRIAVQVAIENVTLFGARLLLYTVIFNLICNAVRYNHQGGAIRITASNDDKYTNIKITDNGIGIDESEYDKIFDPFYRVDQSRSRVAGGSGLGLSIAKEIVEKHGGKIEVQSTPGIETAFIVRLPRYQFIS